MKSWKNTLTPSPLIRGVASILAVAGAVISSNPIVLAGGLLIGILPLTLPVGLFARFCRFALLVILPIALYLLFVWGWLMGAPPGLTRGTAPVAGCIYAATVPLRLAFISGVVFLCFFALSTNEMVVLLRSWGVRGELLTLLIISLALWPEFALRAEQIAAARCARGLMPNRNIWTRARQFPFILRTLFIWAIGNALARIDLWRQQNLLALLEAHAIDTIITPSNTISGNIFFGLSSLAWFSLATYSRFQ